MTFCMVLAISSVQRIIMRQYGIAKAVVDLIKKVLCR